MQYKTQLYWIFLNIGQSNCPKIAFNLNCIDIKIGHKGNT